MSREDHYAQGLYPAFHERWEKFPGGESVDDVARRAEQFVGETVIPHLWDAARTGKKDVQIMIVSHGVCISEFIPALLKRDSSMQHHTRSWRGLANTGWNRIVIEIEVLVAVLSSRPVANVQTFIHNRAPRKKSLLIWIIRLV